MRRTKPIKRKKSPHKKEEEERQGSPLPQGRMPINESHSKVEAGPRVLNDIPPLWKKQRKITILKMYGGPKAYSCF